MPSDILYDNGNTVQFRHDGTGDVVTGYITYPTESISGIALDITDWYHWIDIYPGTDTTGSKILTIEDYEITENSLNTFEFDPVNTSSLCINVPYDSNAGYVNYITAYKTHLTPHSHSI